MFGKVSEDSFQTLFAPTSVAHDIHRFRAFSSISSSDSSDSISEKSANSLFKLNNLAEQLNRNNNQQHQQQQQQQPAKTNTNRYKTELCRPFQENGSCKYGDKCQFAHGKQELRAIARHPKYKTDLCRTYHSVGFCPYGPRCHFIHNLDEMRKKTESQNPSGLSHNSPNGLPPLPMFDRLQSQNSVEVGSVESGYTSSSSSSADFSPAHVNDFDNDESAFGSPRLPVFSTLSK